MPYDLILFDCDGTLVDTEYLNNLAIVEIFSSYGFEQYDINYALNHCAGLRFSEILQNISKETGFTFPAEAITNYRNLVRDYTNLHLKRIDGAFEMVKAAKANADICVVSNGERNNVLNSLACAGLVELFDEEFIFTGAMAKNAKPAPDLFLLAAEKKNVSPSRTLVIEDSLAGVQAAISANMDVWGFYGTHHDPKNHAKKLSETGAKATYNSMTDVRQDIEKLLNKVQSA